MIILTFLSNKTKTPEEGMETGLFFSPLLYIFKNYKYLNVQFSTGVAHHC